MANKTPKCSMCGTTFERKRSTKRFCSDSCRKQYNALPARIESAIEAALISITTAEELLRKHPELSGPTRPMIETIIERAREALPRKAYTRRPEQAVS